LPLEPLLPLPLSSEESDDKLPFELSLPPDGVEVVVVLLVVVVVVVVVAVGVAVVETVELDESLEMGVVVAAGVVDGEAG
jgi:hypothetical protein